MATATMRRAEVAPISPERLTLRAACADLTALKDEIVELEAALDAGLNTFSAVCQEVEAVEAEIAKVCPAPLLRLRMAGLPNIYGEPPEPPLELANQLAVAKAALAKIRTDRAADRERLADLERSRDWREAGVRKCAAAVLRTSPAVARAVEEAERRQREAADASIALNWCVREGIIDTSGNGMAAAVVLARWDAASFTWHDLTYQVPGGRPFAEALDALMADPDAPLPD
jgi:hypothetical protein